MKNMWINKLTIISVLFAFGIGIYLFSYDAYGEDKVITLHYSNMLPSTHKASLWIDSWCKEVEKRTDGKVKVVHHPGASLTPPAQTFDSVKKGIADIGLSSCAYTRGRYPLTELLYLPLGCESAEIATRMNTEFFKKFRPKEFDDYKVLYLFAHGPAIFHTIRPVQTLEDFNGIKIRTPGNVATVVSALGGTPVGMPMNDAYDAIQKGITDGIMSPYETMKTFRLAEVIKYHTESFGSSYASAFVCLMNKEKFNFLPTHVQTVIEEVTEEWLEKIGMLMDELDVEGKKYSESLGNKVIKLPAEENQRWAKRVEESALMQYVKETKSKGLPGDQALQFCKEYIKAYPK